MKQVSSRRDFLKKMGVAGAGAMGLGLLGSSLVNAQEKNYDAAVLNFALNLEYLEAAFYLAAVGRLGELKALGGDAEIILPPNTKGMNEIDGFGASAFEYANEIANDELAHVIFLRTALEAAGAPVADRPVINLDSSFKTAAAAAFGVYDGPDPGFGPNDFDPFLNELFFLHGAFIFEDVGVTAYKGAAPFLTNKGYLEAAAGILAAEAYHSGQIRTLLYAADGSTIENAMSTPPVWNIVEAISDARDSLDGPTDLDQGVVATSIDTANINLLDENGIAYSRTPRQVANIVYLSPETALSENSFFPNGIAVPNGLESDFGDLLSL